VVLAALRVRETIIFHRIEVASQFVLGVSLFALKKIMLFRGFTHRGTLFLNLSEPQPRR